jgi:hypothetical protein
MKLQINGRNYITENLTFSVVAQQVINTEKCSGNYVGATRDALGFFFFFGLKVSSEDTTW